MSQPDGISRPPCDTCRVPPAVRVLRDDRLDRRLQRDGFVVFDLVDPDVVAPLREEFGSLRGWEGHGFQSDLVVPDTDLRRAISTTIAATLDDHVTPLFDGYRPFLRNFLCKHPDPASDLYIHRDWMYVDERSGDHTYVAWVPLEDVDGANGQLRVLRGSHHLDESLRGTELIAPWLDHTAVIEERLLSVPVRSGQCIVFDNRLVHSSWPNLTERPRVVAAVGMRPEHAPLVHFRRTGPSTAVRYDVDEEFFLTETPQGLIAAAPDRRIAETVPVRFRDLSASKLASLIDRTPLGRLDQAHRARDQIKRRWPDVRRATTTTSKDLLRRSGTAIRHGTHSAVDRGRSAIPTRETIASWRQGLPTKAAIAVLAANEATIRAIGPNTPAVWDPSQFDWSPAVVAAFGDIREEVVALLESRTEIPHIEDVTGGIPQGNEGPWRSFVMMHQGNWIDWNCERCPRTTEVVREIPGLTVAGFSVLEAGTHITEHRGPNKGALRYQLGVVVPGADGDCRIRVGDEMLVWREGEPVMFDFTFPHEAWNDSDKTRVLLMLEVLAPLPWYLRPTNRVAQRAMGWFPTTRDLKPRLRALEPTLSKDRAASG